MDISSTDVLEIPPPELASLWGAVTFKGRVFEPLLAGSLRGGLRIDV